MINCASAAVNVPPPGFLISDQWLAFPSSRRAIADNVSPLRTTYCRCCPGVAGGALLKLIGTCAIGAGVGVGVGVGVGTGIEPTF